MFKYVLIILTILIIVLLLEYPKLFETWQSLNINLGNFYQKKNFPNKKEEWEKYKENIGKNTFFMQPKNLTETKTWNYYKKTFISNDGRVIDYQRGSVTTSEGQAYAMRRAVMMNDKVTFDKTYNWTKYNLQHKNDKLFAWLWGQKNLGKQSKIEYGIIDQNGATDAGVEIAISLVFASKIWNQKSYLDDALKIINDIWEKETIEIKGKRILISGIYQKNLENVEVNPSYFMPHTFRIFAEVDKKHDWQKVVDSSYSLINWCIDHLASGLPPDVFYINKKTGKIILEGEKCGLSYDVVRCFYRFYVDYMITRDPRAKKLLSRSRIFIYGWKREGRFFTCFKGSGELENYDEAIGSIALLLPVIKMYDKKAADEIYQNRIRAKYNNKGYWGNPMDYYAQNLVWFGVWLYLNEENIKAFEY